MTGMLLPDSEITCVDCGGRCFPLNWDQSLGEVEPGTVVAYRCVDCLDRWDIPFDDDTTM